MEGILLLIAIVFGVPFTIGYFVGKSNSSKKSTSDDAARMQGQREVVDYFIHFLSKQPKQISKNVILKELGVKTGSKTAAQSSFQPNTIQAEEIETDQGRSGDDSANRIVIDHETTKEQREKRDLQNINTLLYVASFLLVAAAVLFIGAAVDNSFKFVGAWIITIGFYASGMFIHSASKRLRPAAIAFIGTGLALLPFAGLATNIFVLHDPILSWFITSILGLVLFLFATLKLRSQVLAYLTLGFVFSMTTSSVAVLQMGFVWYFLLIILVASLLNIIAFFKPKVLPSVFLKPIDDSGQLAVPIAVFGSWLSTANVPLWQNALVLAIASLHYGVAALMPTEPSYRQIYVFLSRLAASIAVVLFVFDITNKDVVQTGLALTIVATVQILISAILAKKIKDADEQIWLWGGMAVQFVAIALWSNSDMRAELTTMSLTLVTLSGLLIAGWLQKSRFALVGIVVGSVLLFQISKDLLIPSLSNEIVTASYVAMSVAMIVLRQFWAVVGEKKEVIRIGYWLYLTIAIVFALMLPLGWSATYLGVVAVLVAAVSYIEKSSSILVIANALFVVAIYIFTGTFEDSIVQRLLVTSWIAAAIFYPLRVLLASQKDQDRAQIMGVYSVLILMISGLIFVFSENHTIAASGTLLAASILVAVEGWVYKQHEYYEIAILATTLALQRILADTTENVDFLLYANWWAIVFYGLAWMRRQRKNLPATQLWVVLSIGTLLFSALMYIFSYDTAMNASITLLGAAAILAIEGRFTKQHGYYEAAIAITTIALQRMLSLGGDYDLLVYTHWWVVVLVLFAGLRYSISDKKSALQWLIVALCFMSIPTGLSALGDPGKYQLVFLIEHVILLAIGGAANYRLAIQWGASGVGLAVLYWLKDQTYILLGLLGLSLIALAIWRLLKKK